MIDAFRGEKVWRRADPIQLRPVPVGPHEIVRHASVHVRTLCDELFWQAPGYLCGPWDRVWKMTNRQ